MKSRSKIEKQVLRSGIFKVGLNGEPKAVFRLSPKNYPESISEQIIKKADVYYLFSDLCGILSRCYGQRSQRSFTMSDEMQDIDVG